MLRDQPLQGCTFDVPRPIQRAFGSQRAKHPGIEVEKLVVLAQLAARRTREHWDPERDQQVFDDRQIAIHGLARNFAIT